MCIRDRLFTDPAPDAKAAERLSAAVREVLGIDVDVVVRSGPELDRLLAEHPFADGDPARVVIACCDRPVGELAARRLAELATGDEQVRVDCLLYTSRCV